MSYIIEEETGTYTGTSHHRHNGYYAGDFSRVAVAGPEELAAITRMPMPTFPMSRS